MHVKASIQWAIWGIVDAQKEIINAAQNMPGMEILIAELNNNTNVTSGVCRNIEKI